MHLRQNTELSHKHAKDISKHSHAWWDGSGQVVPLGSAEWGCFIQLVSYFIWSFFSLVCHHGLKPVQPSCGSSSVSEVISLAVSYCYCWALPLDLFY